MAKVVTFRVVLGPEFWALVFIGFRGTTQLDCCMERILDPCILNHQHSV